MKTKRKMWENSARNCTAKGGGWESREIGGAAINKNDDMPNETGSAKSAKLSAVGKQKDRQPERNMCGRASMYRINK